MAEVKIEIYLNKDLPLIYTNPDMTTGEAPVKDIEELCWLYKNKYGSFGRVDFFIYTPENEAPFREALNTLFRKKEMAVEVDQIRLAAMMDQLTPMIVVDSEIISKGIYPDLTQLRGGSNSISRGGTGHTH